MVACGELDAPAAPVGTPDVGDSRGTGGDSDLPADIDVAPPEAPILNNLPARYGYDTVPVRGTAAPGLTIYVTLGSSGTGPTTTVAQAGDFCLDVPLDTGVNQSFQVYAQDSRGQTSDPATVVIEQDPSLAETEQPEQPLVELTPGLDFASVETPKEGTLPSLTDDDVATGVLMPDGVLWVDLGAVYALESLEITFPDTPASDDEYYATDYVVLASALDTPVLPPDAESVDWTLVADIYGGSGLPQGDGGVDAFAFAPTLVARLVAINLIENNELDWGSLSENIRVNEIRITGRSTEPLPPQPLTPTCANGKAP